MSAKYTINNTTFSDVPSGVQVCTIRYKKCVDVDWTVAANNVQVYPNGSLVTPYVIHGLLEGTCYQASVQNNCGSPAVIIEFTTPVAPVVCPNITDFSGLGFLGDAP